MDQGDNPTRLKTRGTNQVMVMIDLNLMLNDNGWMKLREKTTSYQLGNKHHNIARKRYDQS